MRRKGNRIYNKWYLELKWWFIEKGEQGKWNFFIAGVWCSVLFMIALLVVRKGI